jgi:hypothetical protein
LAAIGRQRRREVERARELLLVDPRQVIDRGGDPPRDLAAIAGQRRQAQRGVEGVGQRPRVGEPLEGRARQAAIDHPRDRPRQIEGRRPRRHDRLGDLGRGRADEGPTTADQLVGHDPEREHVGRRRRNLAQELLGRQVRHPPDQALLVGDPAAEPAVQDAEVGDLGVAVGRRDQVAGRDAEVADPAAVGEADGAGRR